MSPVYNFASLVVTRLELAKRLFDPNRVFWSDAELNLYINEALQTWNALTAKWRGDFIFNAVGGTTWYDLTDTTNLPNTLRPYTLTNLSLGNIIAFHLLEPAFSLTNWAGVSNQFSISVVAQAIARRRDEVLSATGCSITRRLIGAVNGRITLPDTVIDVRRMAYLPNASVPGFGYGSGSYGLGNYGVSPSGGAPQVTVMWPEDTWGEQSFERSYLQKPPGLPLTWLLSTQPPISFDTDLPPGFGGSYELLTIEAVAAGTNPQLLGIPDDWAHVIKWGALADLLNQDSAARDSLRAAYAEQRYQLGLKLLASAPSLLAMRVANVPLQIDSVRSADLYRAGWQSTAQGTPDVALSAGLNLIALATQPSGPLSCTATVVQNAPLPVMDSDSVQMGREDYDVMLDYAAHLASFKMGGAEFMATMPLLQRFIIQAARYNSKLNELGEYTDTLYKLAQREEALNPRLDPTVLEAAPSGQ